MPPSTASAPGGPADCSSASWVSSGQRPAAPRKGCRAIQWRAMSIRRQIHTSRCRWTWSRNRWSAANRPGRPTRRRWRPTDIIRGRVRPLRVERVEGVPQVREELVAAVEALVAPELHVVVVQGVGHDQVRPAALDDPVGQVVVVRVGVVEKAALLDHEAPGVRAQPPRVPAQRPAPRHAAPGSRPRGGCARARRRAPRAGSRSSASRGSRSRGRPRRWPGRRPGGARAPWRRRTR